MSVTLSDEQCKLIAVTVLPDIRAYDYTHKADIEKWKQNNAERHARICGLIDELRRKEKLAARVVA